MTALYAWFILRFCIINHNVKRPSCENSNLPAPHRQVGQLRRTRKVKNPIGCITRKGDIRENACVMFEYEFLSRIIYTVRKSTTNVYRNQNNFSQYAQATIEKTVWRRSTARWRVSNCLRRILI